MGLALGDFAGGGALCVECSAREVAHIDTRHRLGKVEPLGLGKARVKLLRGLVGVEFSY